MLLGVNISNDPAQASTDCALAQSLGAKWIRVSIEQSNSHAIADLTTIAAAATDHGLLVFQTCQPIGHVQPKTQQQQDAYASHVVECASLVRACGRDNETNGYGSNEIPNAAACAASMVACIEARNRSLPHGILVTDELCPGSKPLGQYYTEPLTFFDAMVKSQPTILHAAHLWIGWHGYGGFGHDPGEVAAWNTCYKQRALDQYIVGKVGAHMIIASSEFGQPTAPPTYPGVVDPTGQAKIFDQYMREMRSQRLAGVHHGPWIWYRLRDSTPVKASDWPAGCGLIDVHGQQKPAALRFTAAARFAA